MKSNNSSIINENESEIIAGLAIAVYNVPSPLCSKEALKSILQKSMIGGDRRNEIVDVLLNEEEDPQGNHQKRVVSVVKFFSTMGSRELLMKVPEKGELDGLVLRAGEVSCTPYILSIEGCTPKNPDGSFLFYSRSSSPILAASTGEHAANILRKTEPQDGIEHPRRQHSKERVRETSSASASCVPHAFSKSIPPPSTGEVGQYPIMPSPRDRSRVAIIIKMLLLFCGGLSSQEKKSFPVHPYLIAQILRERVIPAAIAMLPVTQTVKNPRVEVSRALVEVTNEGAEVIKQYFNSIVVELVTPYSTNKLTPEARFRLFVKEASPAERDAMLQRRSELVASPFYLPPHQILSHLSFGRVWLRDSLSTLHVKTQQEVFSHQVKKAEKKEEDPLKRFAPRRKEDPATSGIKLDVQKGFISSANTVPTPLVCKSKESAPEQSISSSATTNPAPTSGSTSSTIPDSTTTASTRTASSTDASSTPMKYREIYSEKYQRVYYAYTCPETGEEKSSWTLPGNASTS